MKKVWTVLFCAASVVIASCSSDAAEADGTVEPIETDGSASGDSGSGGDGSDSEGSDGGDGAESGSDDDAPEIVGNEDLDLDELAEVAPDAAEALDAIDDLVSIGDCESELVGLAMSFVPEGWECRVLDAPVAGMDGFTLFKAGNPGGVEITIGTPSPLGAPCELLQTCDGVEAIELGSNFEMSVFEMAGVPFIYGTHKTVEAEATVTTATALSDAEIEFIATVLDGVVEI